ncbi:toll/interleukin-1 receptor domain-containing protein [Bradyrhizobium septentrionale]|uniref:Toll/interleukin-1 receptor domain-containing protein n=1 Tax=Bradyrhizobium septentrionale TaxID=1404411 RepID=A0A974A4G3_9BRAD|nr:toll/interleukin-1 receptor domain-containing protein [Bradyrhizobium septentrionale]UGY16749.1 toll/interleukin-1 receptor domain-containing protein [Bradyrhizobium septentrionale]
MAFLSPFYDLDVFVSYSHGNAPGDANSPLMRWTHSLIRELKREIQAVEVEFDELTLWWDDLIDPTVDLTDELREKVRSSGILMIVMSPRYLASSWCKDELEWFRQQVHDRARDRGRVFVIRALRTNESDWPEFLLDGRGHAPIGFRFHDPLHRMPYCWRDTQVAKEEYAQQLWRLQIALTSHLQALRSRRAQAMEPMKPIPASRRIYLHARSEHTEVFESVRRALAEKGITPLTAKHDAVRSLADWGQESRARVETAKRCSALVLLRGDGSESFVGDLLDIGVDERERIQAARGSPLPCAVLDQSGEPLPLDVSRFGIERFDICDASWRDNFGGWLAEVRQTLPASP